MHFRFARIFYFHNAAMISARTPNDKLQTFYDDLYQCSRTKIASGEEEVDTLIDTFDSDERFGLTLILRPSPSVQESLCEFLGDLKASAPSQYYYPREDLHITVLSIIPCYIGFDVELLNISDYVRVIAECLEQEPIPSISITCRGVTASSSCVMVQGFPDEDALNILRIRLRKAFASAHHLQQSIDQRYLLTAAHSTIVRLREPLRKDKEAFLSTLDRNRCTEFGSFTVDAIDLVCNDWYLRSNRTRLLHRFTI